MNQKRLYWAIGLLAVSAVCLAFTIAYDFRIEPVLCGVCGGCAASGIRNLRQFVHWSRPENAAEDERRQHQREIDLHDERKVMLRMRSAWVLYQVTYWVEWVAVMALSVLSVLEIGTPTTRVVMCVLMALVILQLIGGKIIYRRLEQKY